MIQVATLHRARLPLALLILAFAAFALAAVLATRLTVGASASAEPITVANRTAAVQPVQSQTITATTSCGNGAYVTGDMVGDASPAAVYNTLCGGQ